MEERRQRGGWASAVRPALVELPVPLALALAATVLAVPVSALAIAHPAVVLGALLAAPLILGVWAFPAIATIGLLALLPFNGAIVLAVQSNSGAHIGRLADWKDLVIVLLFLRGVLKRRDREGEVTMPRSALTRYLIAYVLFYCVLAAASPAVTPAITALTRDLEGPLLFLAILCLRPSRQHLRAFAFVALTAALVIGAVAVYEHLGPKDGFLTWYGAPKPAADSSFYGAHGQYRSGSFLDSPLTLAFYLAVSAPIAVGAAFAFPRWRPYGFLVAAACVAGIIMSGTRSGYIGGALGLALVLGLALRNHATRTALVGIFLIGVAAAYVSNQNNPQLTRTGENSAKRGAINSTWDYVAAHPLGAGLGTIDAVGQRFHAQTGTSGSSSESTILAKGYEGGVAALFLYPLTMAFLVLSLLATRRRAAARSDPVQRSLAAGAIGAVGAVLAAGLFLGVQELVVEIAVWFAAAFATAWSLAPEAAIEGAAPSVGTRLPRRRHTPGLDLES